MNEDEVQQYSCGMCGAKELTVNADNEIHHNCFNDGVSLIVDKNFVLQPRIESIHVPSGGEECEKIPEEMNDYEVITDCGSCTRQKKSSILEKCGGKKRSKLRNKRTEEGDNDVWNSERVAHLIQLVQDNQIIWNYYIPLKERSKLQVGIAWDVIVEDLKNTFPDVSSYFNSTVVQSKWKSLVDYFWRRVALRPKTTGSAAAAATPESWPFFKNMTFLQEMRNNQKTIDNCSDEDKENIKNEKIRRGRNTKNNGIEQIASALTELAKAQTQPIIPPPYILPENVASKLTAKEKKIRDFLQVMESMMQNIPDVDLNNVLFNVHEIVHFALKAKK